MQSIDPMAIRRDHEVNERMVTPVVSEPDPSCGEEERVWARSYIRVVLTERNYAW